MTEGSHDTQNGGSFVQGTNQSGFRLAISRKSTYPKSMPTLPSLRSAIFSLAEVASLIPEVPKKTIRNLTDRGLVSGCRLSDPRLYSLAGALELLIMHVFAERESSYQMGRAASGIIVHRAEERIEDGIIGTQNDIKAAVCLFRKHAESVRVSWRIVQYNDIGGLIKEQVDYNYPHFHVIAIDTLIERVISRWNERGAA